MSITAERINDYLNSTWNRDKVMAIVQFLPMALAGPTEKAGLPELACSMSNLSKMADAYRAITRLSLIFNAISRRTIDSLQKPKGDVFVDRIEQISHFFHIFYIFFENNAVIASHGVTNPALTRLGGCAVTCWFYVLLTGLVREVYLMINKQMTDEERKHSTATTIKLGCFLLFAMASLPKAGPQLLSDCCGPLTPVHSALRMIAPPTISLSDSMRGLLGLIASACDFY